MAKKARWLRLNRLTRTLRASLLWAGFAKLVERKKVNKKDTKKKEEGKKVIVVN